MAKHIERAEGRRTRCGLSTVKRRGYLIVPPALADCKRCLQAYEQWCVELMAEKTEDWVSGSDE